MSEDPVLAALARLETNVARLEANGARIDERVARIDERVARVEAEQSRLRGQFNNKLDNILDKIQGIRNDADNSHGHMLFGLQQNLTLSQRITKFEDEIRRK